MQSSSEQKVRILIVEDEPVICRVCSQTLTGEGFEVESVPNGSTAERMLGERKYDLVLININTPVMNGKQLYRSILARYAYLANRVIFMTGDLLNGDTKSFIQKSQRLLLPKPFTPDGLKAVVREALGRIEK